MIYAYLVVFVLSACAFTADMILRYMEKIKSFDMETKLFKFKAETIPLHKFLPENITMLFVCLAVAGMTGILMEYSGLIWCFSLPCSIMTGMFACFCVQELIWGFIDAARGYKPPKGEEAGGLDGYCTEHIYGDSWGKACVFYKDREFEVNAVSVNETEIDEGVKIVTVYENDGFYFVVRTDEQFKEE